jgi:hypothetical protein
LKGHLPETGEHGLGLEAVLSASGQNGIYRKNDTQLKSGWVLPLKLG